MPAPNVVGSLGNITLATATATTNALPNGTGIVPLGVGGTLVGATVLNVTTGTPPLRAALNVIGVNTIGIPLPGAQGTIRGPGDVTGGGFVEGAALSWVGRLPLSVNTQNYLYVAVRNDTGATQTVTWGFVKEV